MLRLFAAALISSLCCGCFVFDEIDKGQQWMDDHSASAQQSAKESSASDAGGPTGKVKEEPSLVERAKEWWAKATEPPPPPPDPNDVIVRCKVGDSTQFTRKNECLLRGGHAI